MVLELARTRALVRLAEHVAHRVTRPGSAGLLRLLDLSTREYSSSGHDSESKAKPTASFGYKEVPHEEKAGLVGEVFKSVASSYDLMNDLMSGGLHRLWKQRFVSYLRPFPGMQHLDVAGGTGDIAFKVLEGIHIEEKQQDLPSGLVGSKVIVCDINPAMLEVGQRRAKERGLGEDPALVWLEGNAEALPLADKSVDSYTIAFGIRNVTNIEAALAEAYRVLKDGGHFLCLEFSQVNSPTLSRLYDAYSFAVIPTIGELVAKDRASYQYLVESIRRFPNQEKFANMVKSVGFQQVAYENLTAGAVAIHSGYKL